MVQGGGLGGLNLEAIMKQAQMFQQSFEANKEKLKQETATASVGGNMVTATVDGEKVLKEIKIAKELIEDGDVNAIEDLVVSAVNSANAEMDKKIAANTNAFVGSALGGLGGGNLGNMADMLGGLLGGKK